MEIGWNFPLNNYGQTIGISEAGIETFKGMPFKSLAREICQNSLDAVKDTNVPVRVEFKKIQVEKSKIPDKETLENAFKRCSEFWDEQSDKKAKEFFDNAYKKINNDYIEILRISDFNTTGLDGSDKEFNSNWSNLVKGSGVSDKGGSAGGSFGIGKSAPFACSEFRALIYSTLDINGLKASQGVARLVSFREGEDITQGIGFYGYKKKNTALEKMSELDKNFNRNESGTDIYVLGFKYDEDWKNEIVAAVLDGFIVAIWKGILEVVIDDIVISKQTLSDIFNQYSDLLNDTNTKDYYEVLTNEKTKVIKHDFDELGEVQLYILLKNEFCRKVHISRKSGMKIFEKSGISSYIQFAGVLILEGEEVNKFFRPMETPQHDKWEEERHQNPKLAKRKKKELFKFIKDSVIELGENNSEDELDVEGLGDYLADEIEFKDIDDGNKQEGISNVIKKVEISKVKKEKIKKSSLGINNTLGENEMDVFGESSEDGEGTGKVHGENEKSKKDGTGKDDSFKEGTSGANMKKNVQVKPTSLRIFCSNKVKQEYMLILNSDKTVQDAYIEVILAGEQSGIEANIISAELFNNVKYDLEVNKNIIRLPFVIENKPMKVKFKLDYYGYCSMEVNVYGFSI